MTKEKKSSLFNFVDNLEGDKVVWMIVLLLILLSIVSIFSSTSLLAIEQNTTRGAIIAEQLIVSIVGLGLIVLIYNIKGIKFFTFVSKYCFILCFLMLAFLASHANLGFIKAQQVNSAWRTIRVFGFQFHVFEFTKIAMVMYLAWAIDALDKGQLKIQKKLSKLTNWKWLDSDFGTKLVYIYGPIGIITLLVVAGSVSSALFIGGVMVLTILIGGVSVKELIKPGLIGLAVLTIFIVGVYKISDGKYFNRIGTAISRVDNTDYMKILRDNKNDKSSLDFQNAADKLRQPVGAKIAIKEGGLFGKGPGNSTQRYAVAVMFGDYMYSFIIEEYGLFGGIIVIILYISLLARGSRIVRNCKSIFAKSVVAGLTLLISGQAFMHMVINTDLFGILTGQTLPMVSHGTSSFLMFSIAFGIILSISRMAKKQMDREEKNIILEHGTLSLTGNSVEEETTTDDEIQSTVLDVEDIEDHFNA